MSTLEGWSGSLMLLAGTAIATSVLIAATMPLLQQYALARPNARSSHIVPTPQGGGMAIVAVVLLVLGLYAGAGSPQAHTSWLPAAAAAALVLAITGAVDDIRPLPVLPRLTVQFAAAAALLLTLPFEARILPWLPWVIERAVLLVALVWFINLTNFMDGIDWMTVVAIGPIMAALAALGLAGLVPELAAYAPVAVTVLGGLIGFAPFNRHVARLFLGDAGSLPLGALTGWLLIVLATAGQPVAALILALYYVSDATITLAWRLKRGERLSQAHRSHYYQVAVARGFTVPAVIARVLALNLALAVLAWTATTPAASHWSAQAGLLALAAVSTAWTLRVLACGRPAA